MAAAVSAEPSTSIQHHSAMHAAGAQYAPITPGASLLLSFRPTGRKVLVLGTRRLAASRIACLLEADAQPIIVGTDLTSDLRASDSAAASSSSSSSAAAELTQCPHVSDELQWRVRQRQCDYVGAPQTDSEEAWRQLIDCHDGPDQRLFAVCITDTLHVGDDEDSDDLPARMRSQDLAVTKLPPVARARLIASICRLKRIPINVADRPTLCDFSFPATHRFNAVPADRLQDVQGMDGSLRQPSSLQIAVTTNGKGCRLAGRIRREIVAGLPNNVGDAVERIGAMRDLAKHKIDGSLRNRQPDIFGETTTHGTGNTREPSMRRQALARTASSNAPVTAHDKTGIDADEEDLAFDNTPLNSPVPQLSSPSEFDFRNIGAKSSDASGAAARLHQQYDALVEERRRRMRWVAQMSEYWPIEYIGAMSYADMSQMLDTFKQQGNADVTDGHNGPAASSGVRGRSCGRRQNADPGDDDVSRLDVKNTTRRAESQHSLALRQPQANKDRQGHIYLVGSGPGHPGLLTAMAHRLLTSSDTDLVLSDKLVPSQILSLIPKTTPLRIARKFPGNAEGAQSELIELALEAALDGKRVVRLKQGDPFIYGRGGEEVLAFRRQGIEATVIPGISSAIAAPLLLGIPVTQRGAADSLTLCTGVGRGGKVVALPGYERGRTLIILMGVARLHDVVATLCHGWTSSLGGGGTHQGEGVQPAGQRLGAPFPPYTPIAIIERASSSDQRLVASTLQGIENALLRSGEQRPPGMMVVGWAALSLHGTGNVDVLDDATHCNTQGADGEVELEQRDRARVDKWLGERGSIVREGLDEAYRRALGDATPITSHQETPSMPEILLSAHSEQATANIEDQTSLRGPSGWAPARYGDGKPQGGWGNGEKPLTAAILPTHI